MLLLHLNILQYSRQRDGLKCLLHFLLTVRPPDINIKYWAQWKINTTIFDATGLPWYCYTYRQTHCRPLFHLPADWRPSTDNPAATTIVKIKKRPKDGNDRKAGRPNETSSEDVEDLNFVDGQQSRDQNLLETFLP